MYWELFKSFFKTGLFTFGGGYAMLPILQREVVECRGWASDEEIMDYYAIGQSTPGLIAVNTATFIGYKVGGFLGSVAATAGLVLPSFVIIVLIAGIISEFSNLYYVGRAFAGVRIAVCALVTKAVYGMAKKGVVDFITLCVFAASFVAMTFLKFTPISVVSAAVVVGIVFGRRRT